MNKIKTSPLLPEEFVVEKISDNEANIIAYPFEVGFGVSLAHPLRRFLLGSSVGYAPVSIKIEGAKHEFDSIRGMLEDVSEFIINLKGIRFKINSDEDSCEVNYSFSGPCEIKGSDLSNESVEVVSTNAFLATLNEDAKLDFSIVIKKGIGYVPSEDIRDEIDENAIALDAFFTPVRKAVYQIENVLVEDNPNFEKVILNIVTDGQISPVDAFKDALKVMYSQLAVFDSEVSIQTPLAIERLDESPEIKKLTATIDKLGLSARSYNCLDRSHIKMIGEIVLMSQNDLKNVKNLGKKSFEEILEKLSEYGFEVGSELPSETINTLKGKITAMEVES